MRLPLLAVLIWAVAVVAWHSWGVTGSLVLFLSVAACVVALTAAGRF
jgi:hypothetical protein